MKSRLDIRTLLAVATTLLLWASAFAGIRAGLTAYSPGRLALLRFLVASAALALYAGAARVRLPAWRDMPGIALVGFVGVAFYHTALNYGEVSVPAGSASLLVSASPIFTALLATLWLGERLGIRGWAGIGLSFGGVALITLGSGQEMRFERRALLLVLVALAQALYFILQKPYLAHYRPIELASYAIWAGTLFMTLAFLPGLTAEIRAASLDATLAVVYLGIFPAAVANVTWTYALARVPAGRVASFLYLVPGLAIGIAWIWVGETPAALALLGGVLALGGVVLVNGRREAQNGSLTSLTQRKRDEAWTTTQVS